MTPDGNGEINQRSRADARSLMNDVIRDLEQMEQRQQNDKDRIENARWKPYRIENMMEARGGAIRVRRPRRKPPRPGGPAPTVQDIQVEEAPGNTFVVTFDGSKRVTLSRTLKELIAILAEDAGESPDELVAWKSFARLAEALGARLGRRHGHHAVSQLLWRLREALAAISAGAALVESAPRQGARLRLKRRPPAAGAAA